MAVPARKRNNPRQRGARASAGSGSSPAASPANSVYLAGEADWPFTDDTGTGRGCPPSDSVYAPGGPCGSDASGGSFSDSGSSCGGGE